ncbi:hypothetical protein Bca52824_054998 [Brassica carinata]|uniref:DUF1216 domain-containing protein n=1 Tax=Brassica carinata TaxID=52824 RepID=A0A8X7R6S4_BRACI|nr:hypothetical protein Bca52824_054998 [Brassica carinata]
MQVAINQLCMSATRPHGHELFDEPDHQRMNLELDRNGTRAGCFLSSRERKMTRFPLAICLMCIIVASSTVYEAQGGFLLRHYLRKLPRLANEFEPFAFKIMIRFIDNLESLCSSKVEYKEFFSKLKAFLIFINSTAGKSSSSEFESQLKAHSEGLFKAITALGVKASADTSKLIESLMSMGKVMAEYKRSGSLTMTSEQRRVLITSMMKWAQVIGQFVKTVREKTGDGDIDLPSLGIGGSGESAGGETSGAGGSSGNTSNMSTEESSSMGGGNSSEDSKIATGGSASAESTSGGASGGSTKTTAAGESSMNNGDSYSDSTGGNTMGSPTGSPSGSGGSSFTGSETGSSSYQAGGASAGGPSGSTTDSSAAGASSKNSGYSAKGSSTTSAQGSTQGGSGLAEGASEGKSFKGKTGSTRYEGSSNYQKTHSKSSDKSSFSHSSEEKSSGNV